MHHTVQPAMPRGCRVHHTQGLLLVGDVGRLIADRSGLERLDVFDSRRQLVWISSHDHDGGSSRDQPGGHPLADSAATSGDQVGPVLERKLHLRPLTPKLKQVLAILDHAARHLRRR